MINAYCFYSGEGGWSRHAHSFLDALSKLEPVALIPWDGPPDAASLASTSAQMLRNGKFANASNPSFGIGPVEFMPRIAGSFRAAFVVWETSAIPAHNIEILSRLDEVWTPSEWGRQLLIRNGLPDHKIFVVPEGVDTDLFKPQSRHCAVQQRFRFLCVGKWEERKGIDDLVRAYGAEFDPAEPVELVLHCFNRYLPHLNQEHRVCQLVSGCHAPITMSPPCSATKLVNLYAQSDAFVLPTRAEAWGLPIMEAMACALPVIVTDYSAPTDYMHSGNAYPVRVKQMIDVFDSYFFPAGAELGVWAQADIAHLRQLMRHVFTHPQEAAAKGQLARQEMCERWTWDHAAAIAHRRLRPEHYARARYA